MSRRFLAVFCLALWSVSLGMAAQDDGAYRPPPPPEQPIPFSHKQHAATGCTECHKAATSDVRAGIPLAAQCVTCHKEPSTPPLKTLNDLAATGEIPWRRVVRVPDYVIFSHKTHMATKDATCETCHGKVQEMTATQKVYDMSMAACILCHKQKNAPETCDTCHEPRG
jgi:c(7)-type cytochrome triheme protein